MEVRCRNSLIVLLRFNKETDTQGYVDEDGRGHCISPLLYQTGWVPVQISSDNGTTFNRDGAWLSGRRGFYLFVFCFFFISSFKIICFPTVHTGKLNPTLKATLVNATQWQYYGTPNVGGSLNMTWDTRLVRADKVNLELWGYRETGEHAFAHTGNTTWRLCISKRKKCFHLGFSSCLCCRLSVLTVLM